MSSLVLVAVFSAGAIVAAWTAALAYLLAVARRIPKLGPDSFATDPAPAVTVTVVVAAKDEEAAIEQCVRSLLGQKSAGLDVVAVDDRSSDRTPGILGRLAAESAGRLQVVSVRSLPAGWGGQNHALSTGVRSARGEWILFTDADCRLLSNRAVDIALREALAGKLDLLSILPSLEMPTLREHVVDPIGSIALLMSQRLHLVNDPASSAAFANGAFLLVRRDTYERVGGHERLRGEINDDIALARLVKASGGRIRIASNSGLLSTRFYETAREAWNGWCRNMTGTMKRPLKLFAAAVAFGTLGLMPWIGLAATAAAAAADRAFLPAAEAWAVSVVVAHASMAFLYPVMGARASASLLHPFAAAFVAAALARAGGRVLFGGATMWHGARYESASRQRGA